MFVGLGWDWFGLSFFLKIVKYVCGGRPHVVPHTIGHPHPQRLTPQSALRRKAAQSLCFQRFSPPPPTDLIALRPDLIALRPDLIARPVY